MKSLDRMRAAHGMLLFGFASWRLYLLYSILDSPPRARSRPYETVITPPAMCVFPALSSLIFRHPVSTSNVGGASYRLPGVDRLRPTMYCTCCPQTTSQQLDNLHAPLDCEPVSATAICRARLAVAWVKYALSCYLGRRTQPHEYSHHPIIKIWGTPFFHEFSKAYSWG